MQSHESIIIDAVEQSSQCCLPPSARSTAEQSRAEYVQAESREEQSNRAEEWRGRGMCTVSRPGGQGGGAEDRAEGERVDEHLDLDVGGLDWLQQKGWEPPDQGAGAPGLRPRAAGEDSRCGSPFSFRFSFPLSESTLPLSSRCRRACALFFPSLVLNPAGGKLGARISPARADSPDSPREHLSRAPTRFHPRASLVNSPRGARLAENRRHARLGDDSRRHTHTIRGALDAAIFFPPGRLGDD